MTTRYLENFPTPLLADLVAGRWLPVVGAGFSKNAIVGRGRSMPLWNDLGKSLASEIQNYDYLGAVDAISAFEHEFGRPTLIERLSNLLCVNEARPGNAHRSFCDIEFDVVCTTNFDFLLETQYGLRSKAFVPLIDEDQLAIFPKRPCVSLLKLHGDLNHPKRLIVTERDYDRFLERYPLIATYLANLLITRTAVLIGYSLEDPDFRQIWQVVEERLGRSRRPAYALTVGSRASDIARYERRGVKVINLAEDKSKYGEVLSATFSELWEFWSRNMFNEAEARDEDTLRELSLPGGATSRLCFFAIPMSAQPFYRACIFPVVSELGLVPITGNDINLPGEIIVPKIRGLISRSSLVIIEPSNEFTMFEANVAMSEKDIANMCIIVEHNASIPFAVDDRVVLRRPSFISVEVESFVREFRDWLVQAAGEIKPIVIHEMHRLLEASEYRAAVVSAITSLETALRERLQQSDRNVRRVDSMRSMLEQAQREELLGRVDIEEVVEWLKVRNEVVHSDAMVSYSRAYEIVQGVNEVLSGLNSNTLNG